ncbi:MAG: hypothetical protein ACI4ST_04475 [Candidatus Gallimonas sp.]
MALQVLDENQIVRTIPEVSEVGARINKKFQENMPADGEDGKDGLSIWETTTNTTTGTTSISISTLNTVEGRSVQVGDYIIGNATYSYLYRVTAVNSTTVTVTYRRTLRGATGAQGPQGPQGPQGEPGEAQLENPLTIGGETYNGSAAVNAGRRSWYGTCATAAATSAKEVSDCTGFVLETGAKVSVRFTYANSASSPTLNVNGTGAKSIRNSNSSAGTLTYRWYPYQVVDFVYDGTYWILQQPYVGTTTYYGTSKVSSLTLNGSPNATPSFYAPQSAGTSGYFLMSNGSGEPSWSNKPMVADVMKVNATDNTESNSIAIVFDVVAPTTLNPTGSSYSAKFGIVAFRAKVSSSSNSVTMPITFKDVYSYEVLATRIGETGDYQAQRNTCTRTSGSKITVPYANSTSIQYCFIAFGEVAD